MLAYMSRFALNIAQKRLAARICPDPLGSLQHSPDSVAGLRGRGKEGRGKEEAIPFLSYFLAMPVVVQLPVQNVVTLSTKVMCYQYRL